MLIKVKVFPGSKKEEVIKKSENAFEIRVKEKPVQGRANRRAVELLASYLNIPEDKIKIVKGYKEMNKIFNVDMV